MVGEHSAVAVAVERLLVAEAAQRLVATPGLASVGE